MFLKFGLAGSSMESSSHITEFKLYTNKDTLISFDDKAVLSFELNPNHIERLNQDSGEFIGDAKYLNYYFDKLDTLSYELSPNEEKNIKIDFNNSRHHFSFVPKKMVLTQ